MDQSDLPFFCVFALRQHATNALMPVSNGTLSMLVEFKVDPIVWQDATKRNKIPNDIVRSCNLPKTIPRTTMSSVWPIWYMTKVKRLLSMRVN